MHAEGDRFESDILHQIRKFIMKDILNGYSGWTLTSKSKKNSNWIELRKLFDRDPCFGNILIFVSNGDGYEYKNEVIEKTNSKYFERETKGVNVRISLNGPVALTFDDWSEINDIIMKCKEELNKPS